MSNLRVAVVAEGPTDLVAIEAALKNLLPRPFILTQLQPEHTRPELGSGWGGVLRWCLDFADRGYARFEDDPTLPGFDLFVVHTDADVADKKYADLSAEIASIATTRSWPALPQPTPCPPVTGGVDIVRACLLAWAGLSEPGPKTVLCVPSKAVEAWLAAAVLDKGHALLNSLECSLNVEARLGALPVAQRMKKTVRDYRARERTIVEAWPKVRQLCSQAERFSGDVLTVKL